MPDGRLTKELDLSSSDILELSEQDFRNYILRQDSPLTEPAIIAVERSVGREREKLEDYLEPESGPQKWREIGDQLLPRWAEVASELHHRENYAEKYEEEILYNRAIKEEIARTRELRDRLDSNPCDKDIVEYVQSLRGLEHTYNREVKPDLD